MTSVWAVDFARETQLHCTGGAGYFIRTGDRAGLSQVLRAEGRVRTGASKVRGGARVPCPTGDSNPRRPAVSSSAAETALALYELAADREHRLGQLQHSELQQAGQMPAGVFKVDGVDPQQPLVVIADLHGLERKQASRATLPWEDGPTGQPVDDQPSASSDNQRPMSRARSQTAADYAVYAVMTHVPANRRSPPAEVRRHPPCELADNRSRIHGPSQGFRGTEGQNG